jgi:hypothetical protein
MHTPEILLINHAQDLPITFSGMVQRRAHLARVIGFVPPLASEGDPSSILGAATYEFFFVAVRVVGYVMKRSQIAGRSMHRGTSQLLLHCSHSARSVKDSFPLVLVSTMLDIRREANTIPA